MESLTPFTWQQSLWQQLVGSRDRLPHALLLHGPRGIGKRHFARALAQFLLCETPTEQGTACGHCASCALMAAGNHPDLRWLVPSADLPEREEAEESSEEGESASKAAKASREILIDQVREIGEFLAVAAHRGGRRIVLLMPAEGLNAP